MNDKSITSRLAENDPERAARIAFDQGIAGVTVSFDGGKSVFTLPFNREDTCEIARGTKVTLIIHPLFTGAFCAEGDDKDLYE